MQEFIAGFFKSFQERLNSTLYGAFILALIAWNYVIFITIFLVSNESIINLEGVNKAIYIRDILYPTIGGIDFYYYFGEVTGRIFAFLYHIGIPAFLAYLMIWWLPELGTMAHKKEKEFLKEREVDNFRTQDEIAEEKLKHMKNQDILLEKEESIIKRQKELIRLKQENTGNIKKIQEVGTDNFSPSDNNLKTQELRVYNKVVNNPDIRATFIDMLKYIHKDNQKDDSLIEELGIGNKAFESFDQFSSNKLVGYSYIGKPIGENEPKHYLYFKDLGKKIALQMVKDDYIKEEDLEGKI